MKQKQLPNWRQQDLLWQVHSVESGVERCVEWGVWRGRLLFTLTLPLQYITDSYRRMCRYVHTYNKINS